jgi:hypothetical protein
MREDLETTCSSASTVDSWQQIHHKCSLEHFLVLGEVASQNNHPIEVQKDSQLLATYWEKGASPSFQMPYIHTPTAYGHPHSNNQLASPG